MIDILNDITNRKTGKSLERSDFSYEFQLYLIQRWISMHSDFNVEILNSSINTLYKTLDDEQHFKLMQEIIPITSEKWRYIKAMPKNKKTKKRDVVDISQTFEESFAKIEESLALVLGD